MSLDSNSFPESWRLSNFYPAKYRCVYRIRRGALKTKPRWRWQPYGRLGIVLESKWSHYENNDKTNKDGAAMLLRRLVSEVKIEGCLDRDARLRTHRSSTRRGGPVLQFSLFLRENFSCPPTPSPTARTWSNFTWTPSTWSFPWFSHEIRRTSLLWKYFFFFFYMKLIRDRLRFGSNFTFNYYKIIRIFRPNDNLTKIKEK